MCHFLCFSIFVISTCSKEWIFATQNQRVPDGDGITILRHECQVWRREQIDGEKVCVKWRRQKNGFFVLLVVTFMKFKSQSTYTVSGGPSTERQPLRRWNPIHCTLIECIYFALNKQVVAKLYLSSSCNGPVDLRSSLILLFVAKTLKRPLESLPVKDSYKKRVLFTKAMSSSTVFSTRTFSIVAPEKEKISWQIVS